MTDEEILNLWDCNKITCGEAIEYARADERAEILATIDWLINSDYSSREFESFKSVLFELLKEQK